MHTFCKLKTGEVMFIWSDNTNEETMHLFPIEKRFDYDVTFDTPVKVNYSDIAIVDTNLFVVESYKLR